MLNRSHALKKLMVYYPYVLMYFRKWPEQLPGHILLLSRWQTENFPMSCCVGRLWPGYVNHGRSFGLGISHVSWWASVSEIHLICKMSGYDFTWISDPEAYHDQYEITISNVGYFSFWNPLHHFEFGSWPCSNIVHHFANFQLVKRRGFVLPRSLYL